MVVPEGGLQLVHTALTWIFQAKETALTGGRRQPVSIASKCEADFTVTEATARVTRILGPLLRRHPGVVPGA